MHSLTEAPRQSISTRRSGDVLDNQSIETIRLAWNRVAQDCDLPQAASIRGQRLAKLRARVKDHGAQAVLDAINMVPHSAFLRGSNDRGWRADFDFLVQDKSFSRLLEGFYSRMKTRGRDDVHHDRAVGYAGVAVAPVLDRVLSRRSGS